MVERLARRRFCEPQEKRGMDETAFERIVEGAQECVYVCDGDHRITYMNPALVQRIGRNALEEECYRAIHGYDDVCPFCICKGPGPAKPGRWEIVSPKDGSVYEVSLIPLKNSDGSECRVFIMHDITEPREREKRLRDKRNIMEGIVNSLPGVFFVIDEEMNLICCNGNMERIAGCSTDDIWKRPLLDFLPESDRETVEGKLREALETGKCTVETRLVTCEGEKIPYLLRSARIQVEGRPHLVVTGNDLLERHDAEKLLHQLFRGVEQSPVSIVITDTEGKIEYVNEKFCEVTGYSRGEVVGQNPRILKSGMTSSEEYRELWETITSGGEWQGEFHNRKKNGEIYWEFAYISPIKNADDVVTHYLAVKEDISERKRMEWELHKGMAELTIKYEELRGFFQQEKMASIGQLAAGIAHEINNPMGFISSNLGSLAKYLERLDDFIRAQSDLLEMVTDDCSTAGIREKRRALKIDYILDDGRELIRESQEGAERVRSIVHSLKGFSAVDEAECEQADINECVLSTVEIVWNELKYKAKLVKELGEIPLTRCQPQQINRVIMNLLVNAAHAIEKQGEITVRTWHENGYVFLSVKDSGCGMTPEMVNRIFEPFFTTREVGKGTGLGLSITYDIVKGHNGGIVVESEPGKGTTFTLQLPVIDGKNIEDEGKSGDA